MREVVDDIERWRSAGKRVALARVVGVEGSGPRLPGAATVLILAHGPGGGKVCSSGVVQGRRRPLNASPRPIG